MASFKEPVDSIKAGTPLDSCQILSQIDRFQDATKIAHIPKEHYRILTRYFATPTHEPTSRRWIGMLLLRGLKYDNTVLTQPDKSKRNEFIKNFASVLRQNIPLDLTVVAGRLIRLALHHDTSLSLIPGLQTTTFPKELSDEWIAQFDSWLKKQNGVVSSTKSRFWPMAVHMNTAHLTYAKYSEFFTAVGSLYLTVVTKSGNTLNFVDIRLTQITSTRITNSAINHSLVKDPTRLFEVEIVLEPGNYLWNNAQKDTEKVRFSFLKTEEAAEMRNAIRKVIYSKMSLGNQEVVSKDGLSFVANANLQTPQKLNQALKNNGLNVSTPGAGDIERAAERNSNVLSSVGKLPASTRKPKVTSTERKRKYSSAADFDVPASPENRKTIKRKRVREASKRPVANHVDAKQNEHSKSEGYPQSVEARGARISPQTNANGELNFFSPISSLIESRRGGTPEKANGDQAYVMDTPLSSNQDLLVESAKKKPQIIGFGQKGPRNQGQNQNHQTLDDTTSWENTFTTLSAMEPASKSTEPKESSNSIEVDNAVLLLDTISEASFNADVMALNEDGGEQADRVEINTSLGNSADPSERVATSELVSHMDKAYGEVAHDIATGSQLSQRVNEKGSPFAAGTRLPVRMTSAKAIHEPRADFVFKTPKSDSAGLIEKLRAFRLKAGQVGPARPARKETPPAKEVNQKPSAHDHQKRRLPKAVLSSTPTSGSTSSSRESHGKSTWQDHDENTPPFLVPPNQRDMHETLLAISRRLLTHLSDREVAIAAVSRSYQDGGRKLLESLSQQHRQEKQTSFQRLQESKAKLTSYMKRSTKMLDEDTKAAAQSMSKLEAAVQRQRQLVDEKMTAIDEMLVRG